MPKSNGWCWKTDIVMGNFSLTTYLTINQKNSEVVLKSPKNADKRLFGFSKSELGRLSGKLPKKGRFLVIEATQIMDSIIGTAHLPVTGHVEFRGIISEIDNSLNGCFIKDCKVVAVLKGHKSLSCKNDYKSFYPIITDLTQKHIYSEQILQTPEWNVFDKKLKALTNKATDDIELFLGFSVLSPKLPFSHFNLIFQSDKPLNVSDTLPNERTVAFEEKTPSIAYLKIKNFNSSQKEIAAIFPHIIGKGYQNLIIDLRDNWGGGIEAAMELAKYLLKDSVFIGYFVTNQFSYKLDNKTALESLPLTHAKTTDALIEELKNSSGVRLSAPKPDGLTFKGGIYVLTNKNTASTCEPIIYMLKQKKIATIVGETTAGAMLSAAEFTIQDKYKLFFAHCGFRDV